MFYSDHPSIQSSFQSSTTTKANQNPQACNSSSKCIHRRYSGRSFTRRWNTASHNRRPRVANRQGKMANCGGAVVVLARTWQGGALPRRLTRSLRRVGLDGGRAKMWFSTVTELKQVGGKREREEVVEEMKRIDLARDGVLMEFGDGHKCKYLFSWLRENCKCSKCFTSSGQKNPRRVKSSPQCVPSSVELLDATRLEVTWREPGGGHASCVKSEYRSSFLRMFSNNDEELEKEKNSLRASNKVKVLPEVDYSSLFDDLHMYRWLRKINDHGLCLVRNVPCEESAVLTVSRLIGPPSHTIYGNIFDVKTTKNPINVAYSDAALEPHMDLSYYESPPGLQLLHCIKFSPEVKGGESTFIDSHAVAEVFHERFPKEFDSLCRIPGTFQKEHMEREHPVRMYYQRPHIHTNYAKQVTAVFWSPPFEGPLRVPNSDVEEYYDAYAKFKALLDSDEMWERYGHKFRLNPGDLIIFNNRRMLHGRAAFTSAQGERHLQGTYLEIDAFLNRMRVLAFRFDDSRPSPLSSPNEQRVGTTHQR